jgi:O-antigen/teichoic acid export membrane protein
VPADEEMKPQRRDLIKLTAMAYGVLALIAAQLYLQFSGDRGAGAILGVVVLAAVIFVFWWGHRHRLWLHVRRRRGQSSP